MSFLFGRWLCLPEKAHPPFHEWTNWTLKHGNAGHKLGAILVFATIEPAVRKFSRD
jgi:hypothetical protein